MSVQRAVNRLYTSKALRSTRLDSSIPSCTAAIVLPVISIGLPSGFVPKAPSFVPVIRHVEATWDPSHFSKESTTSSSRFPMAAIKSSAHFLNSSRPSILAPGNEDEVFDDEVVEGVPVRGRLPHLLEKFVNGVDA